MKDYQRQFLEFVIEQRALRFGAFTLKSGRASPYFFDTGLFATGAAAARLGRFYAHTIVEHVDGDFMLFGPAYKGIPLVTATAVALAESFERDVAFAFNRKEIKDHGEGGAVIGAPLRGRVVIVDDVITAGLSVADSVRIINAAGAQPAAVVIALDRCERALDSERSAVQHVEQAHGIPVSAIATLGHLIEFLEGADALRRHLPAMRAYRDRYGV